MTIMVAGGMTFAVPGVMPAAHATNPNLFVSAENSQFDNYMTGAQVIEVVVIDSDIRDTDESKGEPDVTLNGEKLAMAQATDGNWYAYFADEKAANAAENSTDNTCHGLDFGVITVGTTTPGGANVDTEATSIATPNTACAIDGHDGINVLRETKSLNTRNTEAVGGTNAEWPLIQLFELNPTGNVVIQYNKAGGAQTTTLTYDTVDGSAGIELDRNIYPQSAQVHVTVTDAWLNIDPTDEDSWTWDTENGKTYYQVFDENGDARGNDPDRNDDASAIDDIMFVDSKMILDLGGNIRLQDNGNTAVYDDNGDHISGNLTTRLANPVTLTEQGPNTGVFGTYDEADDSILVIEDNAKRGTTATIDYNATPTSIFIGFEFATIDIQPDGDTWNSGEAAPVVLVDNDANKNSRADEDLLVSDPSVDLIPSVRIGSPLTLASDDVDIKIADNDNDIISIKLADTVQSFSDRAMLNVSGVSSVASLTVELESSALSDVLHLDESNVFRFLNVDLRSFKSDVTAVITSDGTSTTSTYDVVDMSSQGLHDITDIVKSAGDVTELTFRFDDTYHTTGDDILPIVVDFFSFGFTDDGAQAGERVNNQIIRLELEEDGDNTGTFTGSLEYVMLNQLNILEASTYDGLSTIADDPSFIVMEDMTGEDDVRVNYLDLGGDGVHTQISAQEPAPSHSGVVTLDSESYKVADTVIVTVIDPDLNTDSDLRDVFTVVSYDENSGDPVVDAVGKAGVALDGDFSFGPLGRLLDVTFNDEIWTDPRVYNTDDNSENWNNADVQGCNTVSYTNRGLADTGFTLAETGTATGNFTGSFQIPNYYCQNNGIAASTTGTDIEVNYVDFRDASGEIIEVGDSAGVRANTGTVSLDRTVYPVPWGAQLIRDGSAFPLHSSAHGRGDLTSDDILAQGDLIIHVRINDPDFDLSASGEDKIDLESLDLPNRDDHLLKIDVTRGGTGHPLTIDDREIVEIAGDAGIFELDYAIAFDDGPESSTCPNTDGDSTTPDNCILQGDILTVTYRDPTDASGEPNTVTDSATFDLRNGALQSDKSVYIIGSDMILTVIEPDWDLDNDAAETYSLDLIEWDSAADTTSMGAKGSDNHAGAFDPEPSDFRETGDSTGIFQVVVEMPAELGGTLLERGEEIELEYTDWGPSGADYVGQEDEDVNLIVFTSNYGATIQLDQKVYSWTDKVYISITAPDHNFDSQLHDEIGETSDDEIRIATGSGKLEPYKLTETGPDTGIFAGEVILTGYNFDADGDVNTGDGGVDTDPRTSGNGPTDGFLEAEDDDGLSVSFTFSEDETVVSSALIRWNLADAQWLEASYPATASGVLRVVDPDMNLNPEAVDNFVVDVVSDSDGAGIELTVTETNEATGIFEGTVHFTVTDPSSGHRLRVSEGDTITAVYTDYTVPDGFSSTEGEDVSATAIIGTIVPPLERAPITSMRVLDTLQNTLDSVSVDQQVKVTADLTNGQEKEQAFAYIVQIQDSNGVTVALSTLDGTLQPGQSFSAGASWTPSMAGTYTATAFSWESLTTPNALSPPAELSITVN